MNSKLLEVRIAGQKTPILRAQKRAVCSNFQVGCCLAPLKIRLTITVTDNRDFFPSCFRVFFAVVCENVTPFVHSLIPIVFVYLTQAETNRLLLTGVPRYTPAHALCQVSS